MGLLLGSLDLHQPILLRFLYKRFESNILEDVAGFTSEYLAKFSYCLFRSGKRSSLHSIDNKNEERDINIVEEWQ